MKRNVKSVNRYARKNPQSTDMTITRVTRLETFYAIVALGNESFRVYNGEMHSPFLLLIRAVRGAITVPIVIKILTPTRSIRLSWRKLTLGVQLPSVVWVMRLLDLGNLSDSKRCVTLIFQKHTTNKINLK